MKVTASFFENSSSLGFGGAISSVGSIVDIQSSKFVECYSEKGGGAIWVTSYRGCYGSTALLNSTLIIDSCSFIQCKSKTSGGAILASPESETLSNIHANIFLGRSKFVGCSANAEGGAISITNFAELAIISSEFYNNIAVGVGGGALHLKNALFLQYCSSFIENMALYGGGGAILWESSIGSARFFGCPLGTTGIISSYASHISKGSWLTCEENHNDTALSNEADVILMETNHQNHQISGKKLYAP